MACLIIKDMADTTAFSHFLAQYAALGVPFLMEGPLGCGKTTLIREMVRYLPGNAEVSSPSFSIYNIYNTIPPIMHCDLYRCKEKYPEEIDDFLDYGLLVVEWAGFFSLPANRLDILFNVDKNIRHITVTGHGKGKMIESALSARIRAAKESPNFG